MKCFEKKDNRLQIWPVLKYKIDYCTILSCIVDKVFIKVMSDEIHEHI